MSRNNKTQKEELTGLATHAEDPILNLSAVADALGRSPQTIGRWVEDGCIPHITLPSGMRKIRKSALIEWLGLTQFGESEGAMDRVASLTGAE